MIIFQAHHVTALFLATDPWLCQGGLGRNRYFSGRCWKRPKQAVRALRSIPRILGDLCCKCRPSN
ncbi:hypothetical protein IE4803_CH02005 [Rhizobium etli bv. phaseoli str. IE4803]|nr:hypothetical protein IE4803_CH02005 [Rhizobium etli bv. phaseoli str. IE4803]